MALDSLPDPSDRRKPLTRGEKRKLVKDTERLTAVSLAAEKFLRSLAKCVDDAEKLVAIAKKPDQ